ncbi:MAG: hypothetical protein IPN42_08960 [Methylococcaceae bacterium]|nr:hypothetical protein [Methylococcaceae bacterium]
MRRILQTTYLLFILTILIGFPGVSRAGKFDNSLWLGNNGNGLGTLPPVLNLDRAGNELRRINTTDATGIAIDPATNRIYLGTRFGKVTIRDLNNPTVPVAARVPPMISNVSFGSDMAFDGQFLWRTDIGSRAVQKIDPTTGAVVFSFDPGAVNPNIYLLGIAWDGTHLWGSEYNGFKGGERILQFTTQGVPTGIEFPAPLKDDLLGGLAFDTTDDTLWIGARDKIYHVDTKGALLGSFNNPDPSRFIDGLEFQGIEHSFVPTVDAVTQAQAESGLYLAYQAVLARNHSIPSFILPSISDEHDTLQDYAEKCNKATGITVQKFSCGDGRDVPGQGDIPASFPNATHCDQPNVLNRHCDPGSKFQVLPGRTADAVAVAHCRKVGKKINEDLYNDIAVIQYNKKNGALCFYQALTNLPGKDIPPPSALASHQNGRTE